MQWLFSMFNCSSHSHWREEEDWVQYFMTQYMYDKVLIERDRAKYNVSNLLTATWHCGETKMTHPGHLASQQTAEMLHRQVKRDVLLGSKPKKTHMEVVTAFADACQLWCSPLVDASTDRPLTLSAPSNCLALCFPPTPDAWMLQDSSRCMRQHGMTNPVKVCSVKTISDAYTKEKPTIHAINEQKNSFYVCGLLKPRTVPPDLAKSLVQELKTTNVTELTELSFVSLPNTSSYEAMIVFVGILCKTKGVLVVKSAVYYRLGSKFPVAERPPSMLGRPRRRGRRWRSKIFCPQLP